MKPLKQYYWYLNDQLTPLQELVGEDIEADTQRLSSGNFFLSLSNAHHARLVRQQALQATITRLPAFTLPRIEPAALWHLVKRHTSGIGSMSLNCGGLATDIESIYRREVTEMIRRDINPSFESLAPITFN